MKRRHFTPEPEFAFAAECFGLAQERAPEPIQSGPVLLCEMTPEERERWRANHLKELDRPQAERERREHRKAEKLFGPIRRANETPEAFEARTMSGLAPGSQWGDGQTFDGEASFADDRD